jgi:hypothetical protein
VKYWPFKRKRSEPEREVFWIEILDSEDRPRIDVLNLHRQRMDWLYDQIGLGNYDYTSHSDDFYNGSLRCYGLYDKNHAMLFKLTWGGEQ